MPVKSKRSISELLKSSKAQKFLKSDLSIDLIEASSKNQSFHTIETSKKQTSKINTSKIAPQKKETSDFQTTKKQTSPFHTTENKTTKIKTSKKHTTDSSGLSFGGFLPLTCAFFEPLSFTELGPGEIKLLLYLLFLRWRYPERPGFVRAALPYLERGTGITRSSVHHHLKRLSDLGLIRCEELNKKIGNLYHISDSFLWKTSVFQTTEKETTEKQTVDVQNPDVSSLKNRRQSSEFQTKELDLLDSLNSSKLSLSESAIVSKYLANIKAAQKREREKRCFLQLLQEYPLSHVEKALMFLQSHGTLSGEPCHSPLSYLTNAADQVFALIEGKNARTVEVETKKENVQRSAILEKENEIQQEKFKEAAWACFRKLHPESKLLEQTLTRLIEERLSKDKFVAPREVLRTLVVMDWYNTQVVDRTVHVTIDGAEK